MSGPVLAEPTRQRRELSRPSRAATPAVVVVVALAILVLAVPALADAVWLKSFTAAAITAIAALGVGLLYGQLGLVSLSQVAFLGLGGWVALRLGHATNLPFPVVLAASGGIAATVGALVGFPALRLSGLYFALITLMAAAAAEVVFQATQFPDGGPGFLGVATEAGQRADLRRPAIATTDPAFFRYTVAIAATCFLVVFLLRRSRAGRAWATIRQSEAAAVSVGVPVTGYKLATFVLASGMTGVAGGLLAASVGSLDVSLFRASGSIILFAVVLVGGAFSLAGVVVAAAFMDLLPRLFDTVGISRDVVLLIFGLGVMQVLATQPAGIAGQCAAAYARLVGHERGSSAR